ncbi:MAG TPA: hypothetical protein DEA66_07625, partial [Flavobacteriales bacterium]|nr:hypothetical protein [Flavobacteriales bacterium]
MATLPGPKRVGKAQPMPNQSSEKAAPTSQGRKDVTTKIFVLDTCVLLFDHSALTNFEDNKVAIPITVLEELDRFKVGNETKHFEARECIRILDRLSQSHSLQDWIPVENAMDGQLRVIMDTDCPDGNASSVFSERTNDHKILDAALCLQAKDPESKV